MIFSSPDAWRTDVYRSNFPELRRILGHSSGEAISLAFARHLIARSEKSMIICQVHPEFRKIALSLATGGEPGHHDMHELLRQAIVSLGNGKCYVALIISVHIHTSPVSISSIMYMIAV